MKKSDIFNLAIDNIKRYKSRSYLCILSVFIGVFAVILISITSDIARSVVSTQLDDIGIRGLSVFKHKDDNEPLTNIDIENIKENLNFIDEIMPVITEFGTVSFSTGSDSAVIWGVDDNFKETFDIKLIHGRLHNKSDIKGTTKTLIIDETLARTMYKRTDIIGKEIHLTISGIKEKFKIIGVIKSQKMGFESILGERMPSFVYVPFTTLSEIRGSQSLSQIAIKPTIALNDAKIKLSEYMQRKSNNISVENLSQYAEGAEGIVNIVAIVLIAIAFISLITSILGVMSTMFSAVSERRQEIGIYMALGASKKDILNTFIYESVMICITGGIIAIFFGIIIYLIVSMKIELNLYFNILVIAIVIFISIACGLLSGILPAKNAAKLNPIDALRDE